MASTRMQARPHTANIWRQWERFTVSGIRVNNKRYTPIQFFIIWLIALIALYLLRVIAKRRKEEAKNDLADDDPAGFWKDRHLIFCLSAGRSGSKHVRNILDATENIRSFHEPNPLMTGRILQEVMINGKRKETFNERADMKLKAIRNELEGTKWNVVYAESSHMFIKTFSDVILHRLGDVANITIVALHRPLANVIWSQYQLGWFTKDHSGLGTWYYDVQRLHENERVLPHALQNMTMTSRIEKLFAYNADVLQRQWLLRGEIAKMQKDGHWNQVRVVDVNIADLSNVDGITQFLTDKIKLTIDQRRLELLTRQDDNERELKKDRVHVEATEDDVRRRVKDIVKQVGRELPVLRKVM